MKITNLIIFLLLVLQARNETPGVPVDQMGAAGLQGTNNNYSIPRGSGRPA